MSAVTYQFYFEPITCTGFGRYSGTQKHQAGFVANGVEVEVTLGRTGGVMVTAVRWFGSKHGAQVHSWFSSADPALGRHREAAIGGARLAAQAVQLSPHARP